MSEWKNKIPSEEGYYWYVMKEWVDGKVSDLRGPEVVWVEINKDKTIDLLIHGSDCPDGFQQAIEEFIRTREPVFMWDSVKEKMDKINDNVRVKREHWLKRIYYPQLP